jgi:hypothetical protein
MKAWSFLQLGPEAQFQGNSGYDDDLAKRYQWDSTVPNHGSVGSGDVAVVRNSSTALGLARIAAVDLRSGVPKIRRRCPRCSSTGFKRRQTIAPAFRCAVCHEEFDRPREEKITVDEYVARYDRGWWPLSRPARELERAYLAHAKQHSIRELDPDELAAILLKWGFPVWPWQAGRG